MSIKLSDFDFDFVLSKKQKREQAYHYNGEYVIGTIGDDGFLTFFDEKMDDGFVLLTKITPRMYKNKKKAKRITKRLNKRDDSTYFIVHWNALNKRGK